MKLLEDFQKYSDLCRELRFNFDYVVMRGYAIGSFGKRPAIVVSKRLKMRGVSPIIAEVKAQVAHFYTVDDFVVWAKAALKVHRYEIGKVYLTNEGVSVKVVDMCDDDHCETVTCSDGISRINRWRYSRDNGRTFGSHRGRTHPKCLVYPPKVVDITL